MHTYVYVMGLYYVFVCYGGGGAFKGPILSQWLRLQKATKLSVIHRNKSTMNWTLGSLNSLLTVLAHSLNLSKNHFEFEHPILNYRPFFFLEINQYRKKKCPCTLSKLVKH